MYYFSKRNQESIHQVKQSKSINIIAAILFLLLTYWQVSCLQFCMKYDIMDWFYPMRYLIGECLQNNTLPVWNPYTNLGYPLHTDPQSGALYPIVWIIGYFLGYSPFTINLEYILHILFAFYGMKKLSQAIGIQDDVAVIVGMSYACCGFFAGNAQHLSWIISAAWIPYVLYFYYQLIQRNLWQDAVGLSLFSFLLLTGGYPAFIITTFYLLLIAFFIHLSTQIYKKEYANARRFLIGNCLFVLMFALQGLVFFVFLFEALPFMVRGEGLSLAQVQQLPFSPQSYISFILPFATGGNAEFYQTDISMANGYFGLIGFLFCLLIPFTKPDRKSVVLGFTGLLFLLIALGDFAFLRAWLYHFVPLMNLFMYPALFRLFALLCFLLLFGISMQKYWTGKAKAQDWKKLKYLGGALIIVFAGIFLYALQKSDFELPQHFSAKAISAFILKSTNSQMVLIQAPVQIILLSFLLFVVWKKRLLFSKYLPRIIALDLFLSVQLNMFISVASEQRLAQLQEKTNQLPKGFPIPRENISTITHYGNGDFYPIWYNNNILLKKIAFDGYNNFKLKNFKQFNDSPGHIEKLKHPLLHWSDSSGTGLNNVEKNIEILSFNPTNVKAKVSLLEANQIVFLQSDYPGWQVKLDGKVIPHFQKENIFIAADIPAGNHDIEFNFYPRHFLQYLGISTFAFLIACLWLWKIKRA